MNIATGYSRLSAIKESVFARDITLLIVRLTLAWIFIYHGGATLFGWFNGPGVHKASIFFDETAGLHPATLFTVVAGATELFGSILVGIGILGRIGALTIAGDMVIAMITVTAKNGISSSAVGGGYELNLSLAALAAVIVIMGTGRYSLDVAAKRVIHKN